jgi:site-specific DNA-cytosine methylase
VSGSSFTVGSLFSGVGGFDLGLERAGMQVVFQCEADPYRRRVLDRHWPDVPVYPDVCELKGAELPHVDLLCGGFPCQDLSVAGSEPDSPVGDPASSSSSPASPANLFDPEGSSSSRTFPDSFPATVDEISPSFSRRWPSSGFTTAPGECWTADSSEFPNDGGVSTSLPDVLVVVAAPRFFLTAKAAAGILRRAGRRGRALPGNLAEALGSLASRLLSREGQPSEKESASPDDARKTTRTSSSVPPSPRSGRKATEDPPATSARTSSPMSDPSASASTPANSPAPSPPEPERRDGPDSISKTPKPDGSSPTPSLFDPESLSSEPTRPEPTGTTSRSTSPPPSTTDLPRSSSERCRPAPTDTDLTPTAQPEDSSSSPKTFVKAHAANTSSDHEIWEERPVARTLAGGELAMQSGASGALATQARGVRRLTPTECERLQSFPDGWTAIPPASS